MSNQQVIPLISNLSAARLKGDPIADAFVADAFADPEKKNKLYKWLQQQDTSLHIIPDAFSNQPLIVQAHTLPAWADKKLLKVGTDFFIQNQNQIMQLLGLLSLPYCYAAADGAMVLYVSQRLRNDAGKRLTETAQFVLQVQQPDAFEQNGSGFTEVLKIRVTHAIARYYTLKNGSWNAEWGLPVNQEDMAGTNLAFSLIVVRGLRKLGYAISYDEQHAFLHLWSVIGFLLGIDEGLIPKNGKEAHDLEKRISERQFKSSEQGRELTRSLITSFAEIDPQNPTSVKEIKQLMGFLLGEDVAALLGIKVPNTPVYLPLLFKTFTDFNAWKSRNI